MSNSYNRQFLVRVSSCDFVDRLLCSRKKTIHEIARKNQSEVPRQSRVLTQALKWVGSVLLTISGAPYDFLVTLAEATKVRLSHAFVIWPTATFRSYPVNDLVGIHDVACLAMNTVREVDL